MMNIGVAEMDITPDFAVDLSGFASREQPSIGVLDPIFARAIYLEAGGEQLLWIACDLLALERQVVESFREFARREWGLEARQVLLSATHTHYAPATVELNACGQRSEKYIGFLEQRVREAARWAIGATELCDLVSADAICDLAVDRRKKPSAHVDPQVTAVGFRAKRGGDDTFIAALINYTMHPVTYGHVERRISADWCGAASKRLAAALPGHPIVAMTNGAAGNINPPRIDEPPETAQINGGKVADAILPALRDAKTQANAILRSRSMTIPIELDWHDQAEIDRIADRYIADFSKNAWGERFRLAINAWRETMKRAAAIGGGKTWDIELQAIRIGDVTILAVNGEMFTRFTDIIRTRWPDRKLFTVAYANAACGYIPTRAAYAEGGYEVETSHFFYGSFRPKEGSLELLAERAVELVDRMDPD